MREGGCSGCRTANPLRKWINGLTDQPQEDRWSPQASLQPELRDEAIRFLTLSSIYRVVWYDEWCWRMSRVGAPVFPWRWGEEPLAVKSLRLGDGR